jgi:hypothetical protein
LLVQLKKRRKQQAEEMKRRNKLGIHVEDTAIKDEDIEREMLRQLQQNAQNMGLYYSHNLKRKDIHRFKIMIAVQAGGMQQQPVIVEDKNAKKKGKNKMVRGFVAVAAITMAVAALWTIDYVMLSITAVKIFFVEVNGISKFFVSRIPQVLVKLTRKNGHQWIGNHACHENRSLKWCDESSSSRSTGVTAKALDQGNILLVAYSPQWPHHNRVDFRVLYSQHQIHCEGWTLLMSLLERGTNDTGRSTGEQLFVLWYFFYAPNFK